MALEVIIITFKAIVISRLIILQKFNIIFWFLRSGKVEYLDI
jgi:hypothetical protein